MTEARIPPVLRTRKDRWLSGSAKLLTVFSGLLSLAGVPLAGLIWFAGGMKTVPGLSAEELTFGLPLPLAATIFGALGFFLELRRKAGFPILATVATIIPLLTTLLLVGTFLSYR